MKMTEYQRKLVEEHLSLVDKVIHGRIDVSGRPLLSYEDFYQIGCEALCHAAMHYDPKRGSFEAFGSRLIYHAMIDHCRKQNESFSKMVELMVDEYNEPVLFQTLGQEIDYDARILNRQFCEQFEACKCKYSGITLRGIEAMELKSLGFTSNEIAERYGTSVNNVNAWISRARSRLRSDPEMQSVFENCC